MKTKKIIQNYWDYRSKTYTNELIDRDQEERASWKRWLSAYTGDEILKVLDVGTGPGFMALLFAEMGHDVTAVDLSPQMVERARDNAKKLGLCIQFFSGDAEDLKFPDETFDIVASKYLLWTLPAPQKALEEWKRVVKKGGTVLAIDGEWHKTGLADELRGFASSLIAFSHGNSYPLHYRKQYNPIIPQLPMYRSNSKMASELFAKGGLSEVSVKSMNPLYESGCRKMSFGDRLSNNGTVYIVSGRKHE